MGAIVLSNFVSSYGQDVALDAAVAISGGLDMRAQAGFTRAKRLWQPMLAEDLRDIFLVGKWGKRVKERLSHEDMLRMMRASDVSVRFSRLTFCLDFLFVTVFSPGRKTLKFPIGFVGDR